MRGSRPAVAGRRTVARGSMLLDTHFFFTFSMLLRSAGFIYLGLNLSESRLFPLRESYCK